jgi:hypothetical protein
MKKVFIILLFSPLLSFSQQKVDVDKVDGVAQTSFFTVSGEPFSTTKYTKVVAGTPYFKKEWMEAILIPVTSTKKYKVEKARLDLLTNEIYFIDNDGVEKSALVNFKEIQFNDAASNAVYNLKVFTNPANSNKSNWYQLIVPGNVALYKLNKKVINESTPYGSSLTEQKITDSEEYFLLMNDKLTAIKSVAELQQLLPEKKQEMQPFINSLKKEKKKSDAFVQAVTYYNTLIN